MGKFGEEARSAIEEFALVGLLLIERASVAAAMCGWDCQCTRLLLSWAVDRVFWVCLHLHFAVSIVSANAPVCDASGLPRDDIHTSVAVLSGQHFGIAVFWRAAAFDASRLLLCDGLRRAYEYTWQNELAKSIPAGSCGGCNRCASRPLLFPATAFDGVVRRRRALRPRPREAIRVPAEFSAAGLMVPEGSMMPFAMPPFDKAGTGCIEYIPTVARSERAAELAASSGDGREARGRANRRRLGLMARAQGWGGSGSGSGGVRRGHAVGWDVRSVWLWEQRRREGELHAPERDPGARPLQFVAARPVMCRAARAVRYARPAGSVARPQARGRGGAAQRKGE